MIKVEFPLRFPPPHAALRSAGDSEGSGPRSLPGHHGVQAERGRGTRDNRRDDGSVRTDEQRGACRVPNKCANE